MDEADERQYVSALAGYDYANVEVLYQILKEAKSLDIEKLCAAADVLDTETVIGRVQFNEQHYSVQSLVTGQWIYNEDGTWSQYIIANTQVPDCPVTSEFSKENRYDKRHITLTRKSYQQDKL